MSKREMPHDRKDCQPVEKTHEQLEAELLYTCDVQPTDDSRHARTFVDLIQKESPQRASLLPEKTHEQLQTELEIGTSDDKGDGEPKRPGHRYYRPDSYTL